MRKQWRGTLRFSYVYLIGPEDASPLKIGIAEDVTKRLCSLQIGNWQQLKVHHTVSVVATSAASVERHMHRELKDRRLRGEWFDVTLDEAKAKLESVAELYALVRARRGPFSEIETINLCDDPQGAHQAVTVYRNAANQTGVKALNERLLRRAGMAPYTVFIQVIVERRDLRRALSRQPHLLAEAEKALIKALNELTCIYREDDAKRHAAFIDDLMRPKAIAA